MASTAKLMIRGASLRVFKTIVSIAIGFMMMPFLINSLGEHLYGLWITVGSVVAAYYLLDLGFSQAVTRYVAKCIHQQDYAGANKIINTSLAIYTFLAGVVVLISLLLSQVAVQQLVDNPDDLKLVQALVVITGISLAFEFPSKAFPGIINAYMRYDTTALVALIKTVVDAALIYIFIKNGYGLVAMALIAFVTSVLSTIFYVYYCHSLFSALEYRKANVDMDTTREIFNFSKWVFVIDANRLFKEKMDVWLIAFYASASMVTVYYVAVRLVEYAIQLLVQATGMSNTLFTKYYALGDDEKLIWAVRLFIKINFFLTIIILCGFYHVGHEFIVLWMGEKFPVELAYPCLLILGVGKLATYATAPLSGLLLTIKQHSFTAKMSILETIASGILCVLLIPSKGLWGAAVAISAPLIISRFIVLPWFSQRHLSVINIDLLSRLIGSAMVASCIAWGAKEKLEIGTLNNFWDFIILCSCYLLFGIVQILLLFNKKELAQLRHYLVRKKI